MAVEIVKPASPYWIFADQLDDGVVNPVGNPNVCCPTCGPYVIASVETMLKYLEAIGYSQNSCCDCCLNGYASEESMLTLKEALGIAPVTEPTPARSTLSASTSTPSASTIPDEQLYLSCTNYFVEEIESLLTLITPAEQLVIADAGIVESGSLNHDLTSNVSDLKTMIMAFYNATGNLLGYQPMLLDLLDKGIVVDCRAGQTIVASVETYLKYAEAVGLTGGDNGGSPGTPP
jgi:hypothetical protein